MKRSTVRNKLDKVCSELVRSRGECVWCGNRRYELLQCCHIYGRANLSVRWDLDNLLCMCAGCHFKAHNRPIEFTEFVINHLGVVKYESLKSRANSLKTWANYELEALYEILKNYQKEMWSGT